MATFQMTLDDDLKANVDELFGDLGLDTETAVRIFLKACMARNGIPFEVAHFDPVNPKGQHAVVGVGGFRELKCVCVEYLRRIRDVIIVGCASGAFAPVGARRHAHLAIAFVCEADA